MLKIFLTFVVSHKVKSRLRLVVNTTCFELAKPSNQQFRLTCRQYDYHCLLDDTFTKEYEVCREWKWIPGGIFRTFLLYMFEQSVLELQICQLYYNPTANFQ